MSQKLGLTFDLVVLRGSVEFSQFHSISVSGVPALVPNAKYSTESPGSIEQGKAVGCRRSNSPLSLSSEAFTWVTTTGRVPERWILKRSPLPVHSASPHGALFSGFAFEYKRFASVSCFTCSFRAVEELCAVCSRSFIMSICSWWRCRASALSSAAFFASARAVFFALREVMTHPVIVIARVIAHPTTTSVVERFQSQGPFACCTAVVPIVYSPVLVRRER